MSLAAFLEMQVPFGTIAAASERVPLNEESVGTGYGDKRSCPGDYRDHMGSVRTLRRKSGQSEVGMQLPGGGGWVVETPAILWIIQSMQVIMSTS